MAAHSCPCRQRWPGALLEAGGRRRKRLSVRWRDYSFSRALAGLAASGTLHEGSGRVSVAAAAAQRRPRRPAGGNWNGGQQSWPAGGQQ